MTISVSHSGIVRVGRSALSNDCDTQLCYMKARHSHCTCTPCYISGVDEKEVGTPDKLPEHTFEVSHSRRRSYLITAENEEDKKAWVETFKVCCRKAQGMTEISMKLIITVKFR